MTARSLKHSLRQFEQTEFLQKQRMTHYGHWSVDIATSSNTMKWTIAVLPQSGQLDNVILLNCKTASDFPFSIAIPLLSFNQILSGFELPGVHLKDPQDIIGISLDIVKSLVLEPICHTGFNIEGVAIETAYDLAESDLNTADFLVESQIGSNRGKAQILIHNLDLVSQHDIERLEQQALMNVKCQEHYILAGAHLPVEKTNQLKIDDVFIVFKLPSPQVLLPGNTLQSEVIQMEQHDSSQLALYEMKVMIFGSKKTIQQLIFNDSSAAADHYQMAYIFLPDRVIAGTPFEHGEQHYFHVKAIHPLGE